MTYLLWHRDGETRMASPRRVLRAAEVPLLSDAQALRDALETLHREQSQRIDAAIAEAREQGHAEGLATGLQEARNTTAATLLKLNDAMNDERERLRAEVGALALEVVRKLVGSFGDAPALVALAEVAAADLLPGQPLVLVVHPDRVDAVRERAPHHEVRADPACGPDDCRLETGHGSVDASLDAQLARLAAAWQSVDAEEICA